MPDGNLLRLPGFLWANAQRLSGDHRDVAASRGPSVLGHGQWMQFHHACCQFPILRGSWRGILEAPAAAGRIVEGPMFDITLSSLHDRATYAVPTLPIAARVGLREMQLTVRHAQVFADAVEAQLAVGAF